MSDPTPKAEPLFRKEDATPISTDENTVKPWADARACLESAPKMWLSTGRPDARPHVAPVLVVWANGSPHFATRPTSRKGKNLTETPHCVLSVSTDQLDLVVEGSTTRARDAAALAQIAKVFADKHSWRFAIRDARVHDDSLPGSPEYAFYEVAPTIAFGYGPDGLTATRWRFS